MTFFQCIDAQITEDFGDRGNSFYSDRGESVDWEGKFFGEDFQEKTEIGITREEFPWAAITRRDIESSPGLNFK